MSQCWGEGELRAWLDRELPAAQALALEQHLSECAACDAAYRTLAARAGRISAWMGELSADIPPAMSAPVPKRTPLWGALAALAAALLLAILLSQRSGKPPLKAVVVEPPPAPAFVQTPVVETTAAMPAPRMRRAPAPVQYYMALDEEPIDTGLVMRVALPSGMQADVIVDGDGRARAIRPVQTVMKEEDQ